MTPFTLLEHTADIGIQAEGNSPEELFVAAAESLCRVLGLTGLHQQTTRHILLQAADREELLVSWLQEILYLLESESFLPSNYEMVKLSDSTLEANLHGSLRPAEYPSEREVKAVTYHGLEVSVSDNWWKAIVYLDL